MNSIFALVSARPSFKPIVGRALKWPQNVFSTRWTTTTTPLLPKAIPEYGMDM
jgi:hypothetical protein